MKKVQAQLLLALLIFLSQPSCKDKSIKVPSAGEADIIDLGEAKVPDAYLANHKPYDFEVYKTVPVFIGHNYEMRYYQEENKKLAWHEAGYEDTLDFDRAAYRWTNDTTVSVRLYSTKTQKSLTLKLFGNGGSSGMCEPTE